MLPATVHLSTATKNWKHRRGKKHDFLSTFSSRDASLSFITFDLRLSEESPLSLNGEYTSLYLR